MEDAEMKKSYKNPVLKVVKLHIANSLLAGSGVTDGSAVGNAVKGTEDYGREFDFTGDDEY